MTAMPNVPAAANYADCVHLDHEPLTSLEDATARTAAVAAVIDGASVVTGGLVVDDQHPNGIPLADHPTITSAQP